MAIPPVINIETESRDLWFITVMKPDGITPEDLTLYTGGVFLNLWDSTKTMKITLGVCVVVNAVLGKVSYAPTATDVNTADTFTGDLRLVDAGAKNYRRGYFIVAMTPKIA